jgi:prepilin-type N-terminal cleavage/methylation domain-containing protein
MVPMRRQAQLHKGFSLLELLLAVSVLGIMSGIALPSFLRQWEDARLNAANRALSSWLDDQRRKAIQNSSPCDISIDTSQARAISQCDFENGTGSSLKLPSVIDQGEGLTLSINQGDSSWSFSPRGTTTTTTKLHLSIDGSEDLGRCLSLSAPLGLIRTARLKTEGICDYTTPY